MNPIVTTATAAAPITDSNTGHRGILASTFTNADPPIIGVVGKPSAGKSSFLNAVSDAVAKVGT